jgi:hypothetical protein
MCFGHMLAPAWFQYIMNIALSRATRKLQHGTYLDDATITGVERRCTWLDTLEGCRCLVAMGLPVNIWKCQFLFPSVQVLGYVLAGERYQLGKKAIAKLFARSLPTNLRELQ